MSLSSEITLKVIGSCCSQGTIVRQTKAIGKTRLQRQKLFKGKCGNKGTKLDGGLGKGGGGMKENIRLDRIK